MSTEQQIVLQKLQELRAALEAADAQSQPGGWMRQLWHDVESAHTRAIGEAAIVNSQEAKS